MARFSAQVLGDQRRFGLSPACSLLIAFPFQESVIQFYKFRIREFASGRLTQELLEFFRVRGGGRRGRAFVQIEPILSGFEALPSRYRSSNARLSPFGMAWRLIELVNL